MIAQNFPRKTNQRLNQIDESMINESLQSNVIEHW